MSAPKEGTPPAITLGPDGLPDVQSQETALRVYGLGLAELMQDVDSETYSGKVYEMLNSCAFVANSLRRANEVGDVDRKLEALSVLDSNFHLERSEQTRQQADNLRRQAGGKNQGFFAGQ